MTGADDLRRERNAENRDQDRYAYGDCGPPSEADDRACPECGGTDIVPTREISSPAFGE